MARRSQSSQLRCLSLAYFIRRPHRLALLCIFFVVATYLFWDRQSFIRERQEQVEVMSKLSNENAKLTEKLDEMKNFLREKGEELPSDLDSEESHDFEGTMDAVHNRDTDDEDDVEEFEHARTNKARHAPVQERVILTGQNDAPADPDPLARERRDKVREAMKHAWTSYETYAWGYDELQPQSKGGVNQFGGLGATILDALDTLFIMGFHDEFKKASDWVSKNLNFNIHYTASVFETTIRVLGGLLSAYDLSGDTMFIIKARELADRLLPAWDTSTGIPMNFIELASGNTNNPHWTGGASVLADLGTEQVEFIGLSQRTGVSKYKEKVEKVITKLREDFPSDGLLPIYISPHNGKPSTTKISFGAMGDSFYEYLLKVWILGNKTQAVGHYREMWEQSMEGLISLVRESKPSSYVYLAERSGNNFIDKMDELACFAPGMLALGMDGATPEKAAQYLKIAEGLAWTCYNFYQSTRTKLAGENYHFRDGDDMVVGTAYNILRPETIESFFYLWRRTGDTKYREWGWNIFQAFEAQSRIPSGYVGMRDVNSGIKDDMMQSFFVAETLKYLYLLFSPSTVIPLEEWVFNTEAHPIRIITRLEGVDEKKDVALETDLDDSREDSIDRRKVISKASKFNYMRKGGKEEVASDYSQSSGMNFPQIPSH